MRIILCILLGASICIPEIAQTNEPGEPAFRIMFWNTENFYDTRRDSSIDDREFLPEGIRVWTPKRYKLKLQHAFKTIVAIGGMEPPDIIGLCEIENKHILTDLIYQTPLGKFPFGIVHKDSPDRRGIDVVMLYRKDKFRPLVTCWIPVNFPDHASDKTRDIVYVKGIVIEKKGYSLHDEFRKDSIRIVDTLHLFFNHWPSRSAGQMETDYKRLISAKTLRIRIDSIFQIAPHAKVFISGDFNDEPSDFSIKEGLIGCESKPEFCCLLNLSEQFMDLKKMGTHKYQAEWAVLDQIIVSTNMLKKTPGLGCTMQDAHIFSADFLLVEDGSGLGWKPFRTYDGYRYSGGFSDHLPVYLDLWEFPSGGP